MSYLTGFLTGVLLTVLVVFLVDNLAVANAPSGTEPQKIVNWDVAVQKLRSSITTVQEEVREVREDVHDATRWGIYRTPRSRLLWSLEGV
jgi:hypothetical protein